MKKQILYIMIFYSSFNMAAVNRHNGGYVYRLQVTAPNQEGRLMPFTLQYSSRTIWSTNIGFGWCADWTTQLEPLGDQRYRLRDCGGDILLANSASASGDEIRQLGQQLWLYRPSGERLRFTPQGLLLERANGPQIERFLYDGWDRLREWQHPRFTVVFSYPGLQRQINRFHLLHAESVFLSQQNGHLEKVHMNGTLMHFEYDELSNLTIIREGQNEVEKIQYDSQEDRVKSITNSKTSLELHYFKNKDGSLKVQWRRHPTYQRLPSYKP